VQYGSFEGYLVAVARRCCERGLKCIFVYPEEPLQPRFRAEIEDAGGALLIVPGTERLNVRGAVRLWQEIRRVRPDIVHAHFGRVGYFGAVFGRLGGAKAVLLAKHQISWPRITWKERAVYSLLSRVVSAYLAVAEPVKEQFHALGVPDTKEVFVRFPGIDTSRYRPLPEARARVRAELGVEGDAPLLAAVAHLRKTKGVDYLVRAFAEVLREYGTAVLVIVGNGAEREALEAQARLLGVADKIRFVGHREDVPEILAAADVFVCPSLLEGSCGSALEAMAAGKPMVVTPVGEARDLVPQSESGVVVAPADAQALAKGLCQVLGQRERWAAMGERGRAIVTRVVALPVVVDSLVDTYFDVATRGDR
jgi:glycosyltransferase involved in cell wall biosynthesis